MKKGRIVLASVLKPVDDTRSFEKIGQSLAGHGFEVFIIGKPSKKTSSGHQNIKFLPLQKFDRLSLARFAAPIKIAKKIHQVKPEVLIVNTHELLIVAIMNRIFFGTNIIYDIQENYWLNILNTDAFPILIRPILATWVRLKEWLTSPLFNQYLLAEKGYEKEIRFIGKKYIVLANKVLIPTGFRRQTKQEKIRLLFSGTLAQSTGIFQAIDLTKKLHTVEPKIELLIIGFCALSKTLDEIKSSIQNSPFITLLGGDQLVPHDEIMDAILHADFGIISYPSSLHIENSIPTKLYEYLGCQLPVLLQDYKPWTEITEPYNASVNLDFSNMDIDSILNQMKEATFYKTQPSNVTWESEEPKLLQAINNIIIGQRQL